MSRDRLFAPTTGALPPSVMPVGLLSRGARASRRRVRASGPARGQASVELVTLLPLLAAVCALAWQAVVAGQAIWLAGSAARAAARAQAIGGNPTAAARSVLPAGLARGASASSSGDGAIALVLPIPSVVGHARLATIHAQARFAPQTRVAR